MCICLTWPTNTRCWRISVHRYTTESYIYSYIHSATPLLLKLWVQNGPDSKRIYTNSIKKTTITLRLLTSRHMESFMPRYAPNIQPLVSQQTLHLQSPTGYCFFKPQANKMQTVYQHKLPMPANGVHCHTSGTGNRF